MWCANLMTIFSVTAGSVAAGTVELAGAVGVAGWEGWHPVANNARITINANRLNKLLFDLRLMTFPP